MLSPIVCDYRPSHRALTLSKGWVNRHNTTP
jgi:hypothetical protein